MGFFSFLGRVLFASLFILSAWQMFNDFGSDGGPAAKELAPKLHLTKAHLSNRFGVPLPDIEVKQVVWAIVALKGLGGLLFVVGNIFGAYLLAFYLVVFGPILYDFYNYGPKDSQFSLLLTEFLQFFFRSQCVNLEFRAQEGKNKPKYAELYQGSGDPYNMDRGICARSTDPCRLDRPILGVSGSTNH